MATLKAWMIKGTNGNLIPEWAAYTRRGAINACEKGVDWYTGPKWKRLYKDGFRAVKVLIDEVE